ncbi:MAG: LuxR C-terminal-related transcriptional regulator [Anaerolineae bacterium]
MGRSALAGRDAAHSGPRGRACLRRRPAGPDRARAGGAARWAAQGQRSKEIAADLGITERTVKAHLARIYNKFGVDYAAGGHRRGRGEGVVGGVRTSS